MDPFAEQLASLCRDHVTRNKWVFVPSHAVGRTLGERIALSGTSWLNLRFVTPLNVALRMGAPFLVEQGIEPSEEGLGPCADHAPAARPAEGGWLPPGPLADQPAARAGAVVNNPRAAHGRHRVRRPAPGRVHIPEKHAELRALLASYEQFCESHHRGDMALVYQEALKHPEWMVSGTGDVHRSSARKCVSCRPVSGLPSP